MSSSKKQLSQKWESYVNNLQRDTPVLVETPAEKITRIKKLETDPEAWFKFHFPKYAYADPAPFHKRATKRFLKNLKWYEVRALSREMAKSTRHMFEVLFAALVQKTVKNVLHVSHNQDNSIDLLTPYRLNLEFNQRLINDYGDQKSLLKWEQGDFVTKSGVAFRAIGGGQSPRGTRNEHARPDCIIIDDFDTDEICRNPVRLKKRWDWVMKALIPTVSVSQSFRLTFLGNIIAKSSTILLAMEKADFSEIINIRDKNGKSNWPEKNSEENIDYILSKISYAAGQQEYFNNPIQEGTVFKELTWGKIPSFKTLRLIVRYGDPAPSDKEAKGGSRKAVVDFTEKNGDYFIIRVRLDKTSNYNFINWYHELDAYTDGKAPTYNYMENNSLQDPFYQQVYRPLMVQINKENKASLFVNPDERKKPHKFTRIEANLEPVNRQGKLIFNEKEKNNPHMIRLKEEFEAVEPTLSVDVGGVDAVEGAKWIIDKKLKEFAPIKIGKRKRSSSKHF